MSAYDQSTQTRRDEQLARKAATAGIDPCDLALEAMPGYVIGDMLEADENWVDQHTEQCNYCRNELHWYERIDNLLDHVSKKDLTGELDLFIPTIRLRKREARYGSMPSPIGDLYIAVSDEGICEIAFGRRGIERFLTTLERRGYQPVSDQEAIDEASQQLREYFSGRRHIFDVPVDLSGVTPFTQDVLRAAAEVPFGQLVTYTDIARSIGRPRATRAVGNALGRNPVPVIVPCHRIVRSDRSIGGYTGGLDIKERLLTIEGTMLPTG